MAKMPVYAGRDVTYLIGTADNDRRHQYLTTDCEADLQGYDRLQRALNFFNHIQQAIPGNQHKLSKVLNVWHSSDDMYGSIPGRAAVFGAHADADSDGFIDTADNCPQLANDQLDSDNDGVGDACDSTPEIIDATTFQRCGNCPFVANEDQLTATTMVLVRQYQGDLQIRRELIVDFDLRTARILTIYKSEYCFNVYVKNTSATKSMSAATTPVKAEGDFPHMGSNPYQHQRLLERQLHPARPAGDGGRPLQHQAGSGKKCGFVRTGSGQ